MNTQVSPCAEANCKNVSSCCKTEYTLAIVYALLHFIHAFHHLRDSASAVDELPCFSGINVMCECDDITAAM